MEIHQNWSAPGFDLPPVAPRTGPFAGADLLAIWWHLCADHSRLEIAETSDGLVAFDRAEEVRLVGHRDLFDYHSPLGEAVDELMAQYAGELPPGTRIDLDSLPWEAADVMLKGLRSAGVEADHSRHAITAVLDLPASFDDYLTVIGKKERHEMRRKRRRFESALGPPILAESRSFEDLDRFFAMHRGAAGEKGSFMDEYMATFFRLLFERAGGTLHQLLDGEGRAVASAFGFVEPDTYYLYNSAYDTAHRDASPGIVLLSMLIERAIEEGRTRFDFLKGDEPYKFRLGAVGRDLFHIEAVIP